MRREIGYYCRDHDTRIVASSQKLHLECARRGRVVPFETGLGEPEGTQPTLLEEIEQTQGPTLSERIADPHYRTRRGDPVTSLEAAASVSDLTEKQQAVLRVLRKIGPSTDNDILEAYRRYERVALDPVPRQSTSGLRSRRSELVALGFVRDTGEKLRLPSGRRGAVWEAIPDDDPL